jgi:hypothetical protein
MWKFCPQCGHKLKADWKFCAECGTQANVSLGSNCGLGPTLPGCYPQPTYPIYPIYPSATGPCYPNRAIITCSGDYDPNCAYAVGGMNGSRAVGGASSSFVAQSPPSATKPFTAFKQARF